jgi:hypothetical protein
MAVAEKIIARYDDDPNGRAYFIPRREAEALVAAQRRQERENKRAGLNPYTTPVGATEITDLAEDLRLRGAYDL